MFLSISAIFITALILGFPLAAMNATRFNLKKTITPSRIIFASLGGFLFSLIITHLTLTLMDKQGELGWVFYIAGLYLCVPYYMKSLSKQHDEREYIVDFIGIASSITAYVIVVLFGHRFSLIHPKRAFLGKHLLLSVDSYNLTVNG